MSSGGVPNRITDAYESCLERFRKAAEESACAVSVPSRPIRSSFFPSGDGSEFSFKTSLYVKNLRSRRLAASKRLDVAVQALETLKKQNWSIAKSTVYLNYFVVSGSEVQLAQSMHYDFVRGGQNCHPMFHLQLDTEAIPANDLRELGVDVDNMATLEASNECWVTTRIPTADMTLPSVLYCLAGDHLPEPIFSQFAEKIGSIQERLPPLEFEPLKKSLASFPAHFKSSHWFAHMFSGNN